MKEVKRANHSNPTSDIQLIFIPPSPSEDHLPEILVVTFPNSAEASLSALSDGDEIVIEGLIDFYHTANGWIPTLRNPNLIFFRKQRGAKDKAKKPGSDSD
ncbi:MAG: hypothetical protein O7G88_04970 [bacterium]|nr:hypothetical protein [bacterium]